MLLLPLAYLCQSIGLYTNILGMGIIAPSAEKFWE